MNIINDGIEKSTKSYGYKFKMLLQIMLQEDINNRPPFFYLSKKNFGPGGILEHE